MGEGARSSFVSGIKRTFTWRHTFCWLFILFFLYLKYNSIGLFDYEYFILNCDIIVNNLQNSGDLGIYLLEWIKIFGNNFAIFSFVVINYILMNVSMKYKNSEYENRLSSLNLERPQEKIIDRFGYISYLLMSYTVIIVYTYTWQDPISLLLFLLIAYFTNKAFKLYTSADQYVWHVWSIAIFTGIVYNLGTFSYLLSSEAAYYLILMWICGSLGLRYSLLEADVFNWREQLGKRENLDYCDMKLISILIKDPNWANKKEFLDLSDEDVIGAFEKVEKFFEDRKYQYGRWLIKYFQKPVDLNMDYYELVQNLLWNTRIRMISHQINLTVMIIFPPLLMLHAHAGSLDSKYQHSFPGKNNLNKLESLISSSKRYLKVNYSEDGRISKITSKYNTVFGKKSVVLDYKEEGRFSDGIDFFDDYFVLNRFIISISRLQTEGVWFEKNGLISHIIQRSGFGDKYDAFLKMKKIQWLNEEIITLQEESFKPSPDIFPQFSSISVESLISTEFEEWLRESHIKRDCNLTLRFLQGLPKSELHAHIGGILDVESQINVGLAIWEDLSDEEKTEAYNAVEPLLKLSYDATPTKSPWDSDWPKLVKGSDNDPRKRGARAAAILHHFSQDPESLQWCLFPSTENRWSKRLQMTGDYFGGVKGYAGYAVPGDLMGSTVLAFIDSDRAVIRKYAEGITKYAKEENLAYFEIRLSPTKYRTDLESQVKFIQSLGRAINSSMDKLDYEYTWRFIISADRSKFEQEDIAEEFMNNFESLLHRLKGDSSTKTWIAGYDVAGKERTDDIAGELLKRFNSLNLELRLKSTFHAGEQADFNNLRSAYQIHTKRVGHALKLVDDKPLMEEFINSGICIEMCPTSNIEVHGYRVKDNPYYRQKGVLAEYPLREYLDAGVKIAICTDNPFISRTNLVNEFITASDLCLDQPLSFYEILQLSYNSLAYAFMDDVEKARIISEVGDKTILHVQEIFQSL